MHATKLYIFRVLILFILYGQIFLSHITGWMEAGRNLPGSFTIKLYVRYEGEHPTSYHYMFPVLAFLMMMLVN